MDFLSVKIATEFRLHAIQSLSYHVGLIEIDLLDRRLIKPKTDLAAVERSNLELRPLLG